MRRFLVLACSRAWVTSLALMMPHSMRISPSRFCCFAMVRTFVLRGQVLGAAAFRVWQSRPALRRAARGASEGHLTAICEREPRQREGISLFLANRLRDLPSAAGKQSHALLSYTIRFGRVR